MDLQKTLRFSFRNRRWAIFLAITVLLSYMVLGSAAFFILENRAHEHRVRRWYLNLALERRQFARVLSRRILNETKQPFVAIDQDRSEKVQGHLVSALKEYEQHLDLPYPDRTDWNLQNSINYAIALLTTIGNGKRLPETASGQVFALFYSLLGVPFLFGIISLIVYHCVMPYIQDNNVGFKRRIVHFQAFLAIYFVWILFIAVYVTNFVPGVNFRTSVYIAVFSALTIQTPYYHTHLEPVSTLVVLVMILLALVVKMLLIFLLVSLRDNHNNISRTSKVNDSNNVEQEKFRAVVDSSGDTKLVK